MKSYERIISIPNDIKNIELNIKSKISSNEIPLQFNIISSNDKFECEVLCVEKDNNYAFDNIFTFCKRPLERSKKFTVVAIVPTGINCENGGHSGDFLAAAKLLGSVSDTFISHPNSFNGADLNTMTPNSLYIEGSTLTRLLMGTVGLLPVRSNKMLLAVEKRQDNFRELMDLSINAASAARVTFGADIDVIEMDSGTSYLEMTSSGRASGRIDQLNKWFDTFNEYKNNYDAFAISSVLISPEGTFQNYFKDQTTDTPNFWGGVERILTHSLSLHFNKPFAHSPMNPDLEQIDVGIVHPCKSPEIISLTYLMCILLGLHQSPKIITDPENIHLSGVISATDINCLITPDRCLGLPILAALAQGIKVIAVDDPKNVMKNDLDQLPWQPGQFFRAKNYLEAAGLISAFKAGISPDTVLRPINHTKIV